MTLTHPLTDLDRAAFDLAIATARKDPIQRRCFDAMLAAGDDYGEVGRAAAYHCQIESLGLMPWMSSALLSHHERAGSALWRRRCEARTGRAGVAHATLRCFAVASEPGCRMRSRRGRGDEGCWRMSALMRFTD